MEMNLTSDSKESIVHRRTFQISYHVFTLLRYFYSTYCKSNFYAAHAATLGCERLASSVRGWKISPLIERINSKLVASIKKGCGRNPLRESYIESLEAIRYREEFSKYGWEHQVRLKYPREHDDPTRQGDLLLLKPYMSDKEKGVLLIQYNDSFKKFVSMYNLTQLGKLYRIILEPSTWGYRDPAILLFLGLCTDVIIQAQYAADYQYIRSLTGNLVPLRIGAGDWVDDERFSPTTDARKIYDIVMVASWQRLKRHHLLFSAVRECGAAVSRIALIGYPSSGRTKDDILSEAMKHGLASKIDIYENVSRTDVSRIIGQSKIGVMLTLREGANKGIYECLFSGVPVVISDHNIGVNREHINQYTGVIASDEELPQKLVHLLDNIHTYDPRSWAIRNTGYKNSTRVLNDCLKTCATKDGEKWTQDIYVKKNDTNGRYVIEKDRISADGAVAHLRGLLRS